MRLLNGRSSEKYTKTVRYFGVTHMNRTMKLFIAHISRPPLQRFQLLRQKISVQEEPLQEISTRGCPVQNLFDSRMTQPLSSSSGFRSHVG